MGELCGHGRKWVGELIHQSRVELMDVRRLAGKRAWVGRCSRRVEVGEPVVAARGLVAVPCERVDLGGPAPLRLHLRHAPPDVHSAEQKQKAVAQMVRREARAPPPSQSWDGLPEERRPQAYTPPA
jgi:hypothetical protein